MGFTPKPRQNKGSLKGLRPPEVGRAPQNRPGVAPAACPRAALVTAATSRGCRLRCWTLSQSGRSPEPTQAWSVFCSPVTPCSKEQDSKCKSLWEPCSRLGGQGPVSLTSLDFPTRAMHGERSDSRQRLPLQGSKCPFSLSLQEESG